MKILLVGLIVLSTYLLFQNRLSDHYQNGYKDGMKAALKTNPPSEELEMVCVGLWIGEQNKKYWMKENASKSN